MISGKRNSHSTVGSASRSLRFRHSGEAWLLPLYPRCIPWGSGFTATACPLRAKVGIQPV